MANPSATSGHNPDVYLAEQASTPQPLPFQTAVIARSAPAQPTQRSNIFTAPEKSQGKIAERGARAKACFPGAAIPPGSAARRRRDRGRRWFHRHYRRRHVGWIVGTDGSASNSPVISIGDGGHSVSWRSVFGQSTHARAAAPNNSQHFSQAPAARCCTP